MIVEIKLIYSHDNVKIELNNRCCKSFLHKKGKGQSMSIRKAEEF